MIGDRGTSRDQKPGWGVTYAARVRITVTAGGLAPLVREGSGAGHGIDADLGQAHGSALKEAETDAMKRVTRRSGREAVLLARGMIPSGLQGGSDLL